MPAEKDFALCLLPDCHERTLQASAIALGVTRSGRTMSPVLTVGKIAAQDGETRASKCLCDGN